MDIYKIFIFIKVPPLHGETLEITLTVPFRKHKIVTYIHTNTHTYIHTSIFYKN